MGGVALSACEICGAKGKHAIEVPLIRVPQGDMQAWLDESTAQRAAGMVRCLYFTATCGEATCKDTAMATGVVGREYPEWRKK